MNILTETYTPPYSVEDEYPEPTQQELESEACRALGEYWSRRYKTVAEFQDSVPTVLALFSGDLAMRSKNIDLCAVVDEFEEMGLDSVDFERLVPTIATEIEIHNRWRGQEV